MRLRRFGWLGEVKMLEEPGLVLAPWRNGEEAFAAVHLPVLALDETTLIGAAWWASDARGWLGWLRPPMLEIHEAGDAPLLMLLQRGCCSRSRWGVKDAEGRRVGRVAGARVLDGRERLIARARWSSESRAGSFQSRSDVELADVVCRGDFVRLRFAEDQPFQPFRRMLLLAATLRIALNVSSPHGAGSRRSRS